MNIEMALNKKLEGWQEKFTQKIRNDQVVTDLKLWVRDKLKIIISKIKNIQKSIIRKAEIHIDVMMPGFLTLRMHNQ